MGELNNFLFEMGLTLEDVFEPDLNKQKEYYKLLCQILDANETERQKLLHKIIEVI